MEASSPLACFSSSRREGKGDLMVQDAAPAWPGLPWARAFWSSKACTQESVSHLLCSHHIYGK